MGDFRFDVAVDCSRRIFERLGLRAEAVTPELLAKVAYAVLDGIYASENRVPKGADGDGSISDR